MSYVVLYMLSVFSFAVLIFMHCGIGWPEATPLHCSTSYYLSTGKEETTVEGVVLRQSHLTFLFLSLILVEQEWFVQGTGQLHGDMTRWDG